jgi:hypothetical protein
MLVDVAAMKAEHTTNGTSQITRGSAMDSTKDTEDIHPQHELLKNLGVQDSNKCTKQRAMEINKLLAKFFHYNALPFKLVESDELADLIKALCPAYYKIGIPGFFWMQTTGVDLVYNDVKEEVEDHLHHCDALMVNMDGWENEKKQQLKIISATGINCSLFASIVC